MAYDQKNQAGRGPKQKTGAGVPSALLQQTEVTDEKSGNTGTGASGTGKFYHPGYKPLVRPARNTESPEGSNEANYIRYSEDQDWDSSQRLDSISESKMKNKWPQLNKRIDIRPTQTGVPNIATVRSINSDTGDYTIMSNRSNKKTTVPRNAMRRLIDKGVPLDSQTSYRNLNNIKTEREKRMDMISKRKELKNKKRT